MHVLNSAKLHAAVPVRQRDTSAAQSLHGVEPNPLSTPATHYIPCPQTLGYDADMQLPLAVVTVAVLALGVWPLLGLSWDRDATATDPAPVEFAADAGVAAHQAAGMTGGRVLDVQTRFEGERVLYSVKVLLDDGHVKIVELPGPPAPTESRVPDPATDAPSAQSPSMAADPPAVTDPTTPDEH